MVEVDNGERLRIIRNDGLLAGNTLIYFENIYSGYNEYYSKDSQEYIWFKKFENFSKFDLRVLWNIFYSGNWDYQEHEYEYFKHREKNEFIESEEDFIEAIKTYDKLWKPINDLVEVVSEILRILPKMDGETYWFSLEETVIEFQALRDTLILARSRGGEEIRIKVK